MLRFLHPSKNLAFPRLFTNSVLPRLGFATKYMKNNLDIFVIQGCVKEMRANFAKIRRNSRILGEKIANFSFRRKSSAKFRRIYCSSPCEISEDTCKKVSCNVQWNYQLTKQNWFVRQELGYYSTGFDFRIRLRAQKSNGPFEERGPGPETVDSFFRYYHVKHGSLGSTVFRYLNAEMPSQ